jgi:hypothetical protein
MMEEQQQLFELAIEGRDVGMARVEAKAGEDFSYRAQIFVIRFLADCGASSGEAITNACKKAGICPHDDRAFGPVYLKLVREGRIIKVGTAKRLKGHYTAGANIWDLVTND